MLLHADGAEFYTNSEFMVWSVQSLFSNGNNTWDAKFPVCIIPIESMRDTDIKDNVQKSLAKILAWSFRVASEGTWPSLGPDLETLKGDHRKQMRGEQLAGGYRACFFGMKADGKQRKEMHCFQRSYLHSFVCDSCLAQREHKGWQPLLNYKNFYESAAHRLTKICLVPSCYQARCCFLNGIWVSLWGFLGSPECEATKTT